MTKPSIVAKILKEQTQKLLGMTLSKRRLGIFSTLMISLIACISKEVMSPTRETPPGIKFAAIKKHQDTCFIMLS